MLPDYIVSVDLGQAADYTAVAVLERRSEPTGRQEIVTGIGEDRRLGGWTFVPVGRAQEAGHYNATHLERLPLGTPYTDLPGRLRAIEAQVRRSWQALAWAEDGAAGIGAPARYPEAAPVELVVDQTGVGRPVVDLLREHGLDPVAVTITGGDEVSEPTWREFRVPKRNLAGAVSVALQTRRLRVAKELPDAAVLKRELENFKAKISLTGHDSYGTGEDWRKENHDDLVLAVAMGVWYGEHREGKATGFVIG